MPRFCFEEHFPCGYKRILKGSTPRGDVEYPDWGKEGCPIHGKSCGGKD